MVHVCWRCCDPLKLFLTSQTYHKTKPKAKQDSIEVMNSDADVQIGIHTDIDMQVDSRQRDKVSTPFKRSSSQSCSPISLLHHVLLEGPSVCGHCNGP